jgi:hypothetical protein
VLVAPLSFWLALGIELAGYRQTITAVATPTFDRHTNHTQVKYF